MRRKQYIAILFCLPLIATAKAEPNPINHPSAMPNGNYSLPQQVSNQQISVQASNNNNASSNPGISAVNQKTDQVNLATYNQPATGLSEKQGQPLALPKRSTDSHSLTINSKIKSPFNNTSSIVISLLVVIGLFLIIAWLGKKNMPQSMTKLPQEVIQVLGKAQLSGKQQLQLVRVGNRLVLLSVTAHGAETLTEITDPVEVEKLIVHCKQEAAGSTTLNFNHLLQDMGSAPAKGFLDA